MIFRPKFLSQTLKQALHVKLLTTTNQAQTCSSIALHRRAQLKPIFSAQFRHEKIGHFFERGKCQFWPVKVVNF